MDSKVEEMTSKSESKFKVLGFFTRLFGKKTKEAAVVTPSTLEKNEEIAVSKAEEASKNNKKSQKKTASKVRESKPNTESDGKSRKSKGKNV